MQEQKPVNNPTHVPADSSQNHGNDRSQDDEIDVLLLLKKYFLPYIKWYAIAAFLGGVVLTAISYCLTPKYETSTLVQIDVGTATNLMKNKLGSLTSLAGMNLNAGDTKFMFNMNYITSREAADTFMAKYDLRHQLFYKDYDEDGAYDRPEKLEKLYKKILGDDYNKKSDDDIYKNPGPSKEQMYKTFQKVFIIDVDQKDMTATITVKWKDPLVAKTWANDYVKLVNDMLRVRAIKESHLKIKCLRAQIDENPQIEVQQSIYSLIEDELKQIAVAESSEDYAFKVIERAFLPEKKVFPKRIQFLLGGAFLGAFGFCGYLVFRDSKQKIFDLFKK
jgi:hypothetical protein